MTEQELKNRIEGTVNDFVDGSASRKEFFTSIMETILTLEKERPPTIKVRIERQDNLEGFAAYLTPSLTQNGEGVVLMNIEATFHSAVLPEEESPIDIMIESIMHEVGHALQEFFGKEFSEEQVESVVEKYRERYLPDRSEKAAPLPEATSEALSRIHSLTQVIARYEGMLKAWEDQIYTVSGAYSPGIAAEKYTTIQEQLQQLESEKAKRVKLEELSKKLMLFAELNGDICNGAVTRETVLSIKGLLTTTEGEKV